VHELRILSREFAEFNTGGRADEAERTVERADGFDAGEIAREAEQEV
jgi:hypothetical protein